MRGAAALLALALVGCDSARVAGGPQPTEVTITGPAGTHLFRVGRARTTEEQAKGLSFDAAIPADGGMLFAPYPAAGPPRVATFWMKDTPRPLDIVFIRADGTIARIAENTVPMSETMISSEEPVAAVLEVNGGRTGELGIAPGDRVRWTPRP